MTETCISQILYEMNTIWRNIMRKENDSIKKRMTGQVQDLRRQVVTKNAFDKEELMAQIVRQRKEVAFAQKQLYNNKLNRDKSNQENAGGNGIDVDRSIKMVE